VSKKPPKRATKPTVTGVQLRPGHADPSRTGGLRSKFSNEVRLLFQALKDDVSGFLLGDTGGLLTANAQWDETKFKRDHGKFSSKGGSGGDDQGDVGQVGTGGATSIPAEADKVADGIIGKGKSLIAGLISSLDKATENQPVIGWVNTAAKKAGELTTQLYGFLEKRYGRATAITIFASGTVIAWGITLGSAATLGYPIAFPGMGTVSCLPALAIAETYKRIKGMTGNATEDATSDGVVLPPEKVKALGEKLVRSVMGKFAGWVKETAPLLPSSEPTANRSEGEIWTGISGRKFTMVRIDGHLHAVPYKAKPGEEGHGDKTNLVEQAYNAIKAKVESKNVTPEDVVLMGEELGHLKAAELEVLKKKLGVKAMGTTKWNFAKHIAVRALAVTDGKGGVKPEPVPPPPAIKGPPPPPPEPGFTGWDTLGRQWQDGKLVPANQAKPDPSDKAAVPFKLVPIGQALGADLTDDEAEAFYRAVKDIRAKNKPNEYPDPWKAKFQDMTSLPPELLKKAVRYGLVSGGYLTAKGAALAGLMSQGVSELRADSSNAKRTYDFLQYESPAIPQQFLEALGTKDIAQAKYISQAQAVKEKIRAATQLHEKVAAIANMGPKSMADELAEEREMQKEIDRLASEWANHKGAGKAAKEKAWQKARDDLNKRKEARWAQADGFRDKKDDLRQKVREALLLPGGKSQHINLATSSDIDQTHGPVTKQNINQAADWLTGIVAPNESHMADIGAVKVSHEPITRAHYDHFQRWMRIKPNEDVGVIIHEWAHNLEYNISGLSEMTHAFIARRCGDEPVKKLREALNTTSFDDHERGRKDKFDLAFGNIGGYYVGKDYGSTPTEVISMGVEKMWRDPVEFCKKDPEYASLIIGVLDGSLRKL